MQKPNINDSIQKTTHALYRYRIIIFVVAFFACYGFLLTRISTYTQQEPVVQSSDQAIKRLKIDEQSIQKIRDLEDQNVEVQALFEAARKNPFSE